MAIEFEASGPQYYCRWHSTNQLALTYQSVALITFIYWPRPPVYWRSPENVVYLHPLPATFGAAAAVLFGQKLDHQKYGTALSVRLKMFFRRKTTRTTLEGPQAQF